MRRAYVRTLLAFSLVVGAGFGLVHAARACEIPAPVQTIDPPGFYDAAAGYTRDVKPMRNFIAQLNASADKGDWTCALSQLRTWADADALMGKISGYQGHYERSWAGTDFALSLIHI